MTDIFLCLLISSDSCDIQFQFDVSHVFMGYIRLRYLETYKTLVCINMNILFSSKYKKYVRGSTEATIHTLAIILTGALNILVSVIP